MSTMIQYVLYLAILVVLAIPLGAYIKNVMSGEKTFLSKVLTPCENLIYKVMRVDREEQMTWKKYAVSVMIFSGIGLVFLFLLQLLQGVLPGNPQHLSGVKWDLAFNTSASFITNTNWQAYSGEYVNGRTGRRQYGGQGDSLRHCSVLYLGSLHHSSF